MASGALDTNVVLDWLLHRSADRKRSVEQLLNRVNRMVPDAVVVETVFVLEDQYHFGRDEVAHNLALMFDEPRLRCNRPVLLQAVLTYLHHPSLSFVDCYLLELVSLTDDILWTFDKKLVNQSSGRAKLLK